MGCTGLLSKEAKNKSPGEDLVKEMKDTEEKRTGVICLSLALMQWKWTSSEWGMQCIYTWQNDFSHNWRLTLGVLVTRRQGEIGRNHTHTKGYEANVQLCSVLLKECKASCFT